MADVQYRSFEEFYQFYPTEHRRSGTRRLHFMGTLLVLLTLGYAVVTRRWGFLALVPLCGDGLAWVGHFAVERDRPETFQHPLYRLAGDVRMVAHIIRGRG